MYKILSKKLRQLGDFTYGFYCTACGYGHVVRVAGHPYAEQYHVYNGDPEKPTFTPAILNNEFGASHVHRIPVCHLTLTDGMLHYLDDCTHEYAGQVIELTDYPSSDEDE